MAFEAITTQEQLEAVLKERLERERAKYQGYDEYKAKAAELDALKGKDLEGKLQDLEKQLKAEKEGRAADAQALQETKAKLQTAEQSALRARVAQEAKLPYELADRLKGATEEELKKDAESLKGLLGHQGGEPMGTRETRKTPDAKDAALTALHDSLFGGKD